MSRNPSFTSPAMNVVQCERVLQDMFGYDKDNSYNVTELAFHSDGRWISNEAVSVKCMDGEDYYIRYTFPA